MIDARGFWSLSAQLLNFADEDPDQPEAACDRCHDDVEQEVSEAIWFHNTYSLVCWLVSYYRSCILCEKSITLVLSVRGFCELLAIFQ